MQKGDIIKQMAGVATTLSKRQCEIAVNCVFNVIRDALKSGDKVNIREFGTFRLKSYPARLKREPKYNRVLPVPAMKVPFFKVCEKLRKLSP